MRERARADWFLSGIDYRLRTTGSAYRAGLPGRTTESDYRLAPRVPFEPTNG